jgi:endonuclease YncB( thermonuclease family)
MAGQVLAVMSGNLISLSRASGDIRTVQLIGISPPVNARWEMISRRHLHMLLAGKFVTVDYHTMTPSGHLLGRVIHGGADINMRMLATGMAQLTPEAPLAVETHSQYKRAQQEARKLHLGIWARNQR